MEHTRLKYSGITGLRTGIAVIAGAALVLSLFLSGVILHPESIGNNGRSLFIIDTALVLLFGAVGTWALCQRSPNAGASLSVGSAVGFMLGIIHILHHTAEFFSYLGENGRGLFIIGAGHTLLILALLCAGGSAAHERTGSILFSIAAGICSAILSALILVAFGLSVNLLFEPQVLQRMREAYLSSGIKDPGAFIVRNAMESALDAFLRLPILALILSFAGGMANLWVNRRERRTIIILALLMPIVFAAGAVLLWYANSLERSARPPYIMVGLLLSAVSLTSVIPVWRIFFNKGNIKGQG